jgi:hypothetical protein
MAETHDLDFDRYVSKLLARLQSWSRATRVQIRMDSEDVQKFLADGRYRNQFETGTSRGALVPARRRLVESVVFGVPSQVHGRYRPIYGYCIGSRPDSPNVIKYGDAVLCLRGEVNRRTTFTFGDSLDEIALFSRQPPFAPSPIGSPSTDSLDGRLDLLATSTPWQATRYGYIESQTFGDVSPADVETIVFTQGAEPADKLKVQMTAAGIKWRIVYGDTP